MYTDADIVQGCLKNEKFFQELLYKQFGPKMFGICLRYTPNRDIAHDIFQEGFIKTFQNLPRFKGESLLGTWMYKIFVTTSINYIQRKLKGQFEVSLNEQLYNKEDEISEDEKEHWLNHISTEEALFMVQQLPEKYRVIINLYAVDKLSHTEIASLLQINEATSRSQLSRARKLLSDMLKKEMNSRFGK